MVTNDGRVGATKQCCRTVDMISARPTLGAFSVLFFLAIVSVRVSTRQRLERKAFRKEEPESIARESPWNLDCDWLQIWAEREM